MLALPIALQNHFFELFEELLAVRVEAAIASGTYDIGLETLIAESLAVTDRSILHTHERTGATTCLLTIRREDKNEPMSLEAVLALAKSSGSPFVVNASSGPRRAASARHRASPMRMEASRNACASSGRFRAMRFRRRALQASHWQIATEGEFTALWLKELAEIPPTRSSEFHLVTGLLLPVWKHLPRAASKVYRLQTDDGERIVGRLIQTADVPGLRTAFNLDGTITLSPGDAMATLLEQGRAISLRGGLGLRVSTVMGAKRIELTGFSDTEVEQLKSFGFFSEIIAWRLRLFLPLEAHTGAEALSRLFLLYPPL